jgi:hypothetical protein
VQRTVELAVPAAVQTVAPGVPRRCGNWCGPGDAGELRVAVEALHAADLTDELRGDQDPAAAFGEQLRGDLCDEYRELALELADGSGQLADAAELIARDPNPGVLLGASEATGDALLPANRAQSASGELELGPHVVEVRAQVVAQAGALRDETLTVIDEQANVELGARELRDREGVESLADRGSRIADRGSRLWRSRRRRSRRTCRARVPRCAPCGQLRRERTTRSP